MNIPTYTSTPGLNKYPDHERFGIYRTTHQELMRSDVEYRRRWRSYVVGIVCVAILPMAGLLGGGAGSLATLAIFLVALCGSLAGIGLLVLRQQLYMNHKIGECLRRVNA